MPQAPNRLRAKFPGHDSEALEVIQENFTEDSGRIRPKVAGYKPTKRESDALDYLWLEWDYSYHVEPKETV